MHMVLKVMAKLGGVTHQAKPPKKPGDIRKEYHWEDLIAHGQMAQPDKQGK